ncbi:hypothetical protein [Streptomyces sp. NPDC050428]|uniref:hypothetical protein n=1 Tax=Streptomyces sp. NPDC050428 TaxID=3155757 RepID=UPI00341E8F58
MSESYMPLYDPERDAAVPSPDLEYAVSQARKVLTEKAAANIHSHDEMIRAATGLDYVLRGLLAALDEDAARA